ncbi:MAG: hypothetical protein LBB85_10265 [Dysgonamonadaceae bacterium]|nr:hypothetical protein [Dysgonamonadaceae bacterium]
MKKFIKRINANEVNAASKYIYPADQAGLYFFKEEVLEKTPNLFLKVIEKENIIINGQKGVVVKIECENVSPFFENYMHNLNMLDNDKCIVDTIFVRETAKGNKITFDWTKIRGENLCLASIDRKQENLANKVFSLNIRSGKSEKNDIIGTLTMDKKIVIDEYSEDPNWVQCFTIDHKCDIVQGYIKKSPALKKNFLFFSLGIFDGLSLLIAVIILVVIAFPIVYLGSIVQALWSIPMIGIFLCIGLILGLIYTVYQLIENILFELFLINLPY